MLALDYGLFSEARSTSADFTLSRFDDSNNAFSSFFKEHFSKESIEKSFRTLKYTAKGLPAKHKQGQKLGELTFSDTIDNGEQHELILNTLEKKVINNNQSSLFQRFAGLRQIMISNFCRMSSINRKQARFAFTFPFNNIRR